MRRITVAAVAALLVTMFEPFFVGNVNAATLQFNQAWVRLNRLTTSTSTGGTVCAKTPATGYTGEGTEGWVDVGFPQQQGATANFSLNTTLSNWSVGTNPDPDSNGTGNQYWAGTTAWAGITTGTGGAIAQGVDNTNHVVRFKSTALTASTWYCFDFGSALTTADTAGYLETTPGWVATYSGGTATPGSGSVIMRTNWATQLVDGTSNWDRITVNAVVPPVFQFTLGATTDNIPATGNLNFTSVNESGGVDMTISTNAANGWVAWTKSANGALKSATVGATGHIDSVAWNGGNPSTLSPGTTAAYGLTANDEGLGTGCTVGIAPSYAYGGANTAQAGAATINFQQIANCTGGTSKNRAVKIYERAAITLDTPAGNDYSDTITVVGAGSF